MDTPVTRTHPLRGSLKTLPAPVNTEIRTIMASSNTAAAITPIIRTIPASGQNRQKNPPALSEDLLRLFFLSRSAVWQDLEGRLLRIETPLLIRIQPQMSILQAM